ncbi:MAG: polysaccharide biosynthesis protein [Gemmatimonadota bacterium]|nr:polysaccharide biosynthesis protein [Gemmatimonadota bacterium]
MRPPFVVSWIFKYRTALLIAVHLVLVAVSYTLAFSLRFEWLIPRTYFFAFAATLPVLVTLRLLAFAYYRLYRGWWRYVGMRDLFDLLKAVGLSTLVFAAYLVFSSRALVFPRSVLIIDSMITIALIGGARFSLRAVRESRRPMTASHLKRLMIIGAGDAGELLLREIQNNPRLGYVPVGFLDDNPRKIGFRIHGVEVLGTTSELLTVLATHPADELIIAIPSAARAEVQAIVDRCIASKRPFKILPAIAALSGQVHMSEVRPVRVEDLLGRDPVDLDSTRLRGDIAGRRVLITGAGGSIGSELVRQVAGFGPELIALVERGESPLFAIEQEMHRKQPNIMVAPVLCDICDRRDLGRVFAEFRPDIVYHAAAFKHVPMMESHITHAVANNVFGTCNVAELAADCGAKFVLISTDKAVSPSNVMGATKRLAEKIVLSLNARGRNHFVAVRFGNVLGSNGSVVPLFAEQIADGGPVTVTHPDATRYFMTIPEAVQLVLQASVLEEVRDKVAMLEMGEPVKIVDLARNLIRLSGFEPDVDISIVFTGLRPGEKLHEQLTNLTEETMPTRFEKIRVVRTEAPGSLERGLELLREAVGQHDDRAVLRRLQEMVPEFVPQASLLAGLRDRAQVGEPRVRSRSAG